MLRVRGRTGPGPGSARTSALAPVGWMLAYVLAGEVAARTTLPETGFAMIWPSAGVASLWILLSARRTVPRDLVLLALAAAVSAVRSGGEPEVALGRVVANVVLALAFRWVVLRTTALKGPDERLRRLTTVQSLLGLGLAAVVAGLLQAGINETAQSLVEPWDWAGLGQRWLRNVVAVFTLTVTGLLLWGWWNPRTRPDREELDPLVPPLPRTATSAGPVEVVALVAGSVITFAVVFALGPDLPLSFMLFLPAAWAGLRLVPPFAALHALATGVATVACTLAGWGIYARIQNPEIEAFVAQGFMGIVFAATVLLALVRRQSDAAQHRSRARAEVLDNVLASVGDAIVLVDGRNRVLLSNDAATRLLGLRTGDRFRTSPHLDLFDQEGHYLTSGLPTRSLALDGLGSGRDYVVRDRVNGDERVLCATGTVLAGDRGGPGRALVTFRDVTAERAEQRTLASFAGVVAHDLKNPLTVVEGWSEMLQGELQQEGPVDRTAGLGMVRRISDAAVQMRTLISELLTYTLARDQDLRPVPVVLADLAGEVAEQYGRQPGARAEIAVACPHTVCAEPLLLRQLLDNLVSNAVKYVPPGVRPRVTLASRAAADGRIEIRVTDNGLGIPPEERERVFDSFYRLDRPGYAGTGLGLAICQRIAERHGGTLQALEGPGGVGSTFSFTLAAPDGCG